ncbi:hypothetical protein CDAR_63011 [Caerostris darwini]|uniref:Uncharacterized protein n=1 Tax=Caerostris darwini TaxID=1538125 RepID=A0AAV4UFY6_9ARAC|nr:hypothetical protein CDAR_63011 [Caerostris darwini]
MTPKFGIGVLKHEPFSTLQSPSLLKTGCHRETIVASHYFNNSIRFVYPEEAKSKMGIFELSSTRFECVSLNVVLVKRMWCFHVKIAGGSS